MSGSITTAFPTSLKAELPSGLHCFLGQASLTANFASGANHFTALNSEVGLNLGGLVAGAGIPANSFVSYIDSATSFYASTNTGAAIATIASGSAAAITITYDTFKFALISASVSGTYGAATTNYSQLGTDEVANGAGYTTGGFAWTAAQNISPATSGTSGYWSFSINPSWTTASFSTSGGLLYNSTSYRNGASGRACGVYSFGGTQTVTSGTFTVLLPANGGGTSILQLN